MDIDLIKEIAKIDNEIEILKTQTNKLKERRSQIEFIAMNELIENNIDRITVGGRTIFIKQRHVAKTKSKIEAIDALKKADFTELVAEGYNTSTLNALIAEFVKEGKSLPASFDGIITPDVVLTVNSRKT